MKALWLEAEKKSSPQVQKELSAKGIAVTPVAELPACLEALKADKDCSVIIDLDLYRKGIEAVQEIRKSAPDVPVIVLASLERLPVIEEAFKNGAWDSVTKQLDVSHLYEIPRAIARCEEKKLLRAEANRFRQEAEKLQTEIQSSRESTEKLQAETKRYREEAEKAQAEIARYRELAQSSQAETKQQEDETGWLGIALQASGDGIFAADAESKLIFTNTALRDLVGYGEEELIGKGINAFVPSLQPDESSWTKLLLPYPQRRWQGKINLKKKDGSAIPVTARIIQALDGKGSMKAVVGICLKQAEPEAKPAAKTPSGDGLSEEMLDNIIDDLQTPLAAMLGYLEIASTITPDQVEPNQVLSIKRSELMARRLMDLISSHIGAMEFDANRLEIHKAPLQIDQILEPAVQSRRSEANIKNIEITVDAASNLPPIPMDGVQMERAIGILLSNAIHLSPPGGGVTVAAKLNGNEIAVAITDTGSGFSAEEIPLLFDKKKKLHRPSGAINTVGLYLAKQIVAKHGGRIDVKSDQLEGNTLTIFLPR